MAQSSETRGIDVTDLIAQGRTALLQGDKARARSLLGAVVRHDPENVEGWLWLSGAHTDPDEITYCLYHVLLLDPDNEQAHEGLAWVKATYGSEQPAPPTPEATPEPQPVAPSLPAQSEIPPPHSAPPQPAISESRPAIPKSPPPPPAAMIEPPSAQPRPVEAVERAHAPVAVLRLLEAGLQVGIVGALLGLLRLVGALRPGTLLLARGSAGEIDAPSALLLAGTTALLHALAVLVAWVVLSRSLSRARNDRQGDLFDSLVRVAQALAAGYVAAPALLLAGTALNWSERRWLPVVAVVWGLLVVGGVWIVRRLVRLLDDMRVSRDHRALRLVRIVGPALLIALVGLGLAGLAVQSLLRIL